MHNFLFIQRYLLHAVSALALTCCLSTTGFAQNEEIDREAKLAELKETIEALKTELKGVIDQRSSLLGNLEESEKKISELAQKVQELKTQLNDNQTKLRTLEREKGELARAKKQQKSQVSEHVNAAYRLGHQSTIKLLLNQNDPTKITRNLKYLNYLIQARAKKIQAFETTLARIEKVEPEIRYEQQQLESNRKQLSGRRQDLMQAQSQRRHTLSQLEAIINNKDQELQAKEEDRKRLERLFASVIQVVGELEQAINIQKISQLKGQLPWPANGKIKHRYGSTRVAGKLRWQGMVITADEGTSVTPIHYGQVVFSDYLRGHGLLVIVDHGNGFMSLYAHNQALYRSVGEWVTTDDIIAAIGNTGGAKQAGLYFELRYRGNPTNPHHWLSQRA